MRLVQILIVAMCFFVAGYNVWAANPSYPDPWDAGYYLDPTDTDSVSQGDNHMRAMKQEIGARAEAEHDWGEFDAIQGDTGRHLLGSARPFFQDGEPNALVEEDYISSDTLDNARLWIDTDDGRTLYVHDANGVSSDADSPPEFQRVIALPQHAIILWTQGNGDVNCDGVLVAGQCPCGFERDLTFINVGIRGADSTGVHADIPDTPGSLMNDLDGTPYDDTLDPNEMPSHDHDVLNMQATSNSGNGSSDYFLESVVAAQTGPTDTETVGGDLPHYHPFQTVLFCKKT